MNLLLAVLLSLLAPQDVRPCERWRPAPPEKLFEIEKVVDGDTIHIRRAGEVQKLRLLSVDTEEKITGRPSQSTTKPETIFGQESMLWAQDFFAGLAEEGKRPRIGLLFPDGVEAHDVYGRLLCHVLLPDGTDFNLLLVRQGWSPYFNKYGYSRICHEAFADAQEAARSERLGVWHPDTNRAKTPGAPEARRPYDRLLPWWEARAKAIDTFRTRHAEDPVRVVDAEDKDALQAALELCRKEPGARVEVFGSIYRIFDEQNGDWTVLLRSPHRDDALRVRIAKDAKDRFSDLDLRGTLEEFRQNFLWVRGPVTRGSRGFRMTASDPAQWRIASPAVASDD